MAVTDLEAPDEDPKLAAALGNESERKAVFVR